MNSIYASNFSAALTEKGDIYVWGSGVFGEFYTPQQLNNSKEKFTNLSIGFGFGFATDMNGRLYCWGDNTSGQLGFGDDIPRNSLTENTRFNQRKIKNFACGGQYIIGIFQETSKNIQKNNIINNIMNDMTTSKKKQPGDMSISNRRVVHSTEMKDKM